MPDLYRAQIHKYSQSYDHDVIASQDGLTYQEAKQWIATKWQSKKYGGRPWAIYSMQTGRFQDGGDEHPITGVKP